MKRLYTSLQIIGVLICLGSSTKMYAQCYVEFDHFTNLCDLSQVIVQAVPVSGTPPFTFLWETGETTQQIIVPNVLGDYLLTMTDANGCTHVINCHIKSWSEPVFYPWTAEACEGDVITLFLDWIRDEIPNLQYEWSTGETTPTITVTENITWTVTVTDPATGCEFVSQTHTVEFDELPEPEIVGASEICDGQTITLTVEGGPFLYIEWYPIYEYDETVQITEPGTYWVYVLSDENPWCSGADTIVVTEGSIDDPIVSAPPDLCDNQTGTVSVTNYQLFESFLWSNGETEHSFETADPGTYSVTVTDAAGCTATANNIVIEDAEENELTGDITSATCGLSNGSIHISYSIAGSYTFEWSDGSTGQHLEDVPSGSYSVTVTNDEGCYSILDATIPEEETIISVNENITPNTSCSEYNGAIDLFISPDEPYTFLWSNGETTEDLSDLSIGNYTVTISLGATCSRVETYFVDDISAAPDLDYTLTPSSCGENNGIINLQLSGGTAPFEYEWSNGDDNEDLIDVPAGTYMVTVTAADGCVSNTQIILPEIDMPINIAALTGPNTSCNTPNGSIDITITPSNTYSIVWSNGATTEDITGLGAGTYIVEVSNGGCSVSDTFTIVSESLPFDVTGITSPNTSCQSLNGAVNLNIQPVGSYTYVWSNGNTNEDLQNLAAGSYSVTVTNSSGCSIASTFIIENQSSLFTISGLAIANTSCQVPNGSIDIAVLPVSAGYTYNWSTGSVTEDIQGVSAGTYSVTVTNADGCTVDTSFTILNQSAPFTLSSVASPDTSCTAPSGSIDLSVTPSGTYAYLWSTGATTEDLQSLSEGLYSITVSDASSSCTTTGEISVVSDVQKPSVNAIIQDEVCGEGNGSIDISFSPSGSNITWSTGSATEDLTGLSSGAYYITVTSPNGCTVLDTFSVGNSSNSFSVAGFSTDNTSCTNPNGSLNITVTPAGTYTFAWSTGATTEDLSNLYEGMYSVTVADPLNCTSSQTFTLSNNTQDPIITPVVTPETCDKENGQILLSITPPTGNTFVWSNGNTTEDLQNINSGNYSLTVTSSNGCSSTAAFVVADQNSNLQIAGTTTDNTSCTIAGGAIDLSVTPVGSYSYAWSNGASTVDLQGLAAGTYIVTVTDQFQCEFTETFTVVNNTLDPVISSSVTPATCGHPNGSVDIHITLTTGNTFAWSNGETGEDLTDVLPGTYEITVTSSDGCTAQLIVEIPNQNSNFSVSGEVADNASCTQPEGAIDLTILPVGAYTYVWSNGSNAEDLSAVVSGIYSVTVTDQFNCSTSEEYIIEDLTVPPVLSFEVIPTTCGNANGKIDLTVMPESSTNEFAWSTGDNVEDLTDLITGNYSVTVTDRNGCTAREDFTIPGSDPLQLSLVADLSALQAGSNVLCSLQLNVPISAIDSIYWFPQNILSCHDPICIEQYLSVLEDTEVSTMVVDTNGCRGQAVIMLRLERDVVVYVPNVFTPNQDGSNDKFTIYANGDVKDILVLEIFDRWGNCVFINNEFPANDPEYGWDGVFSNKPMNPDVFAFRAVVRYLNGEEQAYKGDITLVR